jgi:hypothetical protein
MSFSIFNRSFIADTSSSITNYDVSAPSWETQLSFRDTSRVVTLPEHGVLSILNTSMEKGSIALPNSTVLYTSVNHTTDSFQYSSVICGEQDSIEQTIFFRTAQVNTPPFITLGQTSMLLSTFILLDPAYTGLYNVTLYVSRGTFVSSMLLTTTDTLVLSGNYSQMVQLLSSHTLEPPTLFFSKCDGLRIFTLDKYNYILYQQNTGVTSTSVVLTQIVLLVSTFLFLVVGFMALYYKLIRRSTSPSSTAADAVKKHETITIFRRRKIITKPAATTSQSRKALPQSGATTNEVL